MTNKKTIICLLCGNTDVEIYETLAGEQIHTLWRAIGINLSARAFGPITPDFQVDLFRCTSCGFRFYDPALAGGAEFYEEMMSVCPYPSTTPEFAFALDFARRNGLKQVLDVGGGEGHFLDLARSSGMITSGVELNRNAALTAADKGHLMFNKQLEDITIEELNGGTDLLTLFQVVEHVPSPVTFLSDAACLVRPGGYIVIAVPNERRMLGLLHYDPPNWPPHHVSRWRTKDLSSLAKRTGLNLIKQGSDPLLGRSIPWAVKIHNQMATALGNQNLPSTDWLVHLTSLAYRFLGCKYYAPCHGLSIYAVFKKPAGLRKDEA